MRVYLIANEGDGDPGWVGEHLVEVHGAALVRCWRETPQDWPDVHGGDLVVSLGSDWSVYWDHVRPFVTAEAALLRQAHEGGVPVLGICFGAQMLAHALGGAVEPAPQPEVGWYDIELVADAPFDSGPWFQWHADRVRLPPSARLLAQTPQAVQSFALDRSVAVQFHPEVTESMVLRWASGEGRAELERLGADPDAVLESTAHLAHRRRHAAAHLVDAVVRGVW
jgi:GMP synthase-like glutamine amidotransferase